MAVPAKKAPAVDRLLAQHGKVLGQVGADGERLEGTNAGEVLGFRVLDVSKQVDIKLSP